MTASNDRMPSEAFQYDKSPPMQAHQGAFIVLK